MSLEALLAGLGKGAFVPFFLVTNKDEKMQVNTQRIIEAVVIGAVMAFIGFIAIVPRLEERIDRVLDGQIEQKADIAIISKRLNVIESSRFTQADGREIRNRVHEHQRDGHPDTVKELVSGVRDELREHKRGHK
jgi:hypothetical protein